MGYLLPGLLILFCLKVQILVLWYASLSAIVVLPHSSPFLLWDGFLLGETLRCMSFSDLENMAHPYTIVRSQGAAQSNELTRGPPELVQHFRL